ncbi:hypothetical protein BDV95DRAFT_489379 [Massariosphaeria phaeospora]|uniref:ADF-H domain-containing protein n=1 Tax=Massariosphaeria phaeospora TaxID=100035 RepID=A0A7C8MDB2_9PLEO|nr:hypothetical protein BDV95DRAFT_489379 [Massariosphaeria phaeospora]
MSLNGLDHVRILEAYQGALAEAGGWFLLKYATRDAVDVLTRGTGGAAEARGAVAQYEETSPLYGFLLYRRRKVLIKYVPEGTSRLLQARVAVHFTTVTDKFTPHDAVISISSADELSDSALTAACSLHTAAPSSCSSSGSSKRHKLDGITEDAEEGHTTNTEEVTPTQASDTAGASDPAISEATSKTELVPEESPDSAEAPQPSPLADTDTTGGSKSTPELSHVTVHTVTDEDKENEQPKSTAADYRASLKDFDSLFEHGPDPRLSSQTARPAYDELYAEYYAQYTKPKVKLGPRPKASLDVKRPHTSGNGAQNASRPVSTLPAGLRAANRKTAEPKRPKSRDSSVVPSIAFPPPPPVPSVPEISRSPSYQPKSPASVKSMPVPSHMTLGSKSTGTTPEKQRLMRALELRKKQMKARKEKQETKNEEILAATDASSNTAETDASISVTPDVDTFPSGIENDLSHKHEEQTMHESEPQPVQEDLQPPVQEDSQPNTIDQPMETDDQTSAASASSPTSAQTQGSSCAPSTRPSSISEDDQHLNENDVEPDTSEQKPSEEDTDKGTETIVDALYTEEEKESIESSPTVVPECDTAIPSVEISAEVEPLSSSIAQTSLSDETTTTRSKRESMILLPPGDTAASRRRSNRESMIFMPSTESSQHDEPQSKRSKRESVIMPSITTTGSADDSHKSHAFDPNQLHPSTENSDADYLSDDSFMEELQSAKVEQAKHVSVSKSPITPYFPRKSSISEISMTERSASQPYSRRGRLSPEQLGTRQSSGSWFPHASPDTAVVAKKINVSSGISQRIKALAEKSNRDSSASVSPTATPDASASIVSQRKSSFFSTPPSGNSPNGKPIQRLSRASFVNLSSPTKKSVPQPPPINTEPTVYNLQQGAEKPESVQVTARIVRDARVQKPTLTMPNQSTPLELHQSHLIIDHQKSARPSSSSKHSPVKTEPTSPRPTSSSHSREASSSALPRSSSESSWRSFGRRRSESRSAGAAPRSQSTHSSDSLDERREDKKEKKDSRTTKLFKRMSTMSSISRKSQGASPILQEEALQSTFLPSVREPPPAVQVGDLNIQFPDTLLWKRRWVELDAMGNLVLSLSKSNESKGITKRFHLSEILPPYAPDQDRQELPNSVVLDFIDGRTLQCACETYAAQAQVLQILREAHDAWLAYNQQ